MSEQNLAIFDVEFALSQFSGNQVLLIKILDKFIEQNESFAQEMKVNLAKTDLIDAKRQIHTLKGVAGNLGFKALATECHKVESHFQGSVNEKQFSVLLALLETSLDSAKKYCSPTSNNTANRNIETADNNSVASAKQQLISVLNNNEFLSDDKIAQYIEPLALSENMAKKLTQFIDDFDYKNAILMLK